MINKNFILIYICLLGVFYSQQVKCQCEFTDQRTGSHYVGECMTKVVDNTTIRYPDGNGKETYTDGSYFVGNFSNGQKTNGTYYFTDGTKYEGTFQNNEFDGSGTYFYEPDHKNKVKYEGIFKNGMYNGYGVLTYKDGSTDDGFWKDDVFLGAKIGEYQGQDVMKKRDTIVVVANSRKYLLSEQTMPGQGNEYYNYIPGNSFVIAKDLQGNEMPPIGYVTTTSQMSNSTLSGEKERFAKSAVGCKFIAFNCDKAVYERFKQYCDWEIYRMENTVNVRLSNLEDFSKWLDDQRDILESIQWNAIKNIGNQIFLDEMKNLLGEKNPILKTVVDHMDASLFDCTIEATTDIYLKTTLLNYPDMQKNVKDCTISVIKPFVKESLKDNAEFQIANKTSFSDWYMSKVNKDVSYDFAENIVTKTMDAIPDIVENCIPDKAKKYIFKNVEYRVLYHIFKNTSYLSDIFKASGAHIGYSVEGGKIESQIADEIKIAGRKHDFLKNYKSKYEDLIGRNPDNCLEYSKAINQLHDECFASFGTSYEQEEYTRMQYYVFGTKEIPKYGKPSSEELNFTIKQQQQATDKSNNNLVYPDGQQTITLTTPTALTSSSTGEQFTAQPGDQFEGEIKDGKVIQGKVIRNGETVKIFLNKRNF